LAGTIVLGAQALALGGLAWLLREIALARGLRRFVVFSQGLGMVFVCRRGTLVTVWRALLRGDAAVLGGRLAILHRRHPVRRRRTAVVAVLARILSAGEMVTNTGSEIARSRRAISLGSVVIALLHAPVLLVEACVPVLHAEILARRQTPCRRAPRHAREASPIDRAPEESLGQAAGARSRLRRSRTGNPRVRAASPSERHGA
jgi:hypothetical protein